MRKYILAAAILMVSTFGARANNRNFRLYNDSSVTIAHAWTSDIVDRYWRAVTPFSPIPPGDYENITFDNSGPCQIQLKVDLADGTSHEWDNGFNLCRISQIHIWLNNSGIYEATSR
jgi:hypothetical protein